MKKLALSFVMLFAFCTVTVFAQSNDTSQGTTGSSPTATQGTSTNQSGAQSGSMSSGQSGSMSSDDMHKDKGMAKGEKTMKGCIQSQGGQFMLEEHGGKMVNLSSSQDLSAHVGHTVKVHGSYASGDSSAASTSTSKMFNVSSVDMVSDTCSMSGKMDKKDKMGNPGNTTTPQ